LPYYSLPNAFLEKAITCPPYNLANWTKMDIIQRNRRALPARVSGVLPTRPFINKLNKGVKESYEKDA
jgi:hypothetical protein